MRSAKNTTQPAPKWQLVETVFESDYNIEILEGEFAGLVFRFDRLGFIPEGDGVKIHFHYDLIHTAHYGNLELTSEACSATIIHILREYLNLGDDVGSH